MEKEYLNCKLALSPQCPHWGCQEMDNLLAQKQKQMGLKMISISDINAANKLCEDCEAFIEG